MRYSNRLAARRGSPLTLFENRVKCSSKSILEKKKQITFSMLDSSFVLPSLFLISIYLTFTINTSKFDWTPDDIRIEKISRLLEQHGPYFEFD